MRNLVVCCDGTWNTPAQEAAGVPVPTNVVRIYNALAETDTHGTPQLRYYHPGVGAEGNLWERFTGGAFGAGLVKNVLSAYHWLCDTYHDNDRIFLFGFSRGAYTARSVAALISESGLTTVAGFSHDDAWNRVEAAYHMFRQRTRPDSLAKEVKGIVDKKRHSVYFLGVWDTVGALGIPRDMAILSLFDHTKKYRFLDTTLTDKVGRARHAVAIDEMRAGFTPTLWSNAVSHPDAKQMWFPGVHSDVGGGYLQNGLSNAALNWMMDEAAGCGLQFKTEMRDQVVANARDVLHDSARNWSKVLRTQPRSVPQIAPQNAPAILHASVKDRHEVPPIAQAPYRPTRTLAVGHTAEVTVYAAEQWNGTGIYLETDATYTFTATGQWLDDKLKLGPQGCSCRHLHYDELGHYAGWFLGKLERLWRWITGNQDASLWGAKRVGALPWFALVGIIANAGNPQMSGTPAPPERLDIKASLSEYTVRRGGYLFCFANDAWHFYGNNRGSVRLVIERVE